MSRVYRAETLRFCQTRLPNRRFGEGSINVIRFYHFFSFILRVLKSPVCWVLRLYLGPDIVLRHQSPDIVLQGPDIVPSASPQGPDIGSLRLYVRDIGSLRLYFAFQSLRNRSRKFWNPGYCLAKMTCKNTGATRKDF